MSKHYENLELHGNIELKNDGQIKNLKVEKLNMLPPFVTTDEGRTVYLISDKTMYYNDGVVWKPMSAGTPNRTIIYIDDVTATAGGNIFNKVHDSSGLALATFSADTTNITVHFTTETGSIAGFKPNVTVNGVSATLTQVGMNIWEGSAAITQNTSGNIVITHEDDTTYTSAMTLAYGPTITSALISGYPVGQTELKAGDTITITVNANQPMTEIQFLDNGLVANVASIVPIASSSSAVVTATIANRGTSPQALGVLLRAKNANGSYGSQHNSATAGSVDGTNVVVLNNTYPSINISSIVYPATQGALKNSEVSTINHTITNYDTVAYTSPNSELSIANATTYEAAKLATRINGSYNVATANFRITATRTANAAITVSNSIVKIANVAPTVTVTLPATRLRSGGNNGTTAQNYVITLSSNQEMASPMSVDAPAGTFIGSWVGTQTSTRTLSVHDNDAKGLHTFTGLSATNLAGIQQTTITNPDYTIGGFVLRTLTVPMLSSEVGIGTSVSDTSKLRCSNLSKGASGSLNFAFAANTNPAVDTYTITQPADTYSATGNLWHNNDELNTLSNTSGTMQIELEELV